MVEDSIEALGTRRMMALGDMLHVSNSVVISWRLFVLQIYHSIVRMYVRSVSYSHRRQQEHRNSQNHRDMLRLS